MKIKFINAISHYLKKFLKIIFCINFVLNEFVFNETKIRNINKIKM